MRLGSSLHDRHGRRDVHVAAEHKSSNSAVSGEYGSASEGILQQSVNGQYLNIMGYGVNANAFNSGGANLYGTTALGQTTSLTSSSGAWQLSGSNRQSAVDQRPIEPLLRRELRIGR